MLTFNEDEHRYFWNGNEVPSVTTIIRGLSSFSSIPRDVLDKARQQGVAIHATVEFYEEGTLDEPNLPEWLCPFLAAWKKFKDDTGFVVDASEKRLYHKQFCYAGTADLFGIATKLPKLTGRGIVDLKRSLYADPATGVQLAGYAAAEDSMQLENRSANLRDMKIKWRAGLKLQADGNCSMKRFESKSDWPTFQACLVVHRWMQEHRT